MMLAYTYVVWLSGADPGFGFGGPCADTMGVGFGEGIPHGAWGGTEFFLNFGVFNCIFWCIQGTILSATLLLDILHTRAYMVIGIAGSQIYLLI